MKGKIWFRRKTYGWGWTPCTWQGWTSVAVFVTCLVVPKFLGFEEKFGVTGYLIYTSVLVCLLIAVSFLKGETPRWQWGRRPNE